MKKIVYVILHYITLDDTIKCIKSIQKLKSYKTEIVVVDNNSPNKSGIELQKKYLKSNNVHIILNEKNLGFSAGNNIGFKYAKYNLKADYIILLNNDTYLLQKNFNDLIVDSFNRFNYSVMGPKIITKDSICGPLYEKPYSLSDLKRELTKLKIKYIAQFLNIKLKKFWKKNVVKHSDFTKLQENVTLHGCFLIFSPIYIKKFDGILEKTFFYFEEIILFNNMKKNNLKMLYNPELEIFHNEFSATNYGIKSTRKRELIRMKRLIDALKIVIKDWYND